MMGAPATTLARTTRPAGDPVTDVPVIELVRPLPGFPELNRFALVQLDDAGELCSLTSLDQSGLRFLVVPPDRFFPDYAPVVDDATVADLEIGSAEDVLVLVVLTAGQSLADTTANLAAPVLVNPATRRAAQVVLDEPGLPVAAPLLG
jgi:flagellar assembly factor FliW